MKTILINGVEFKSGEPILFDLIKVKNVEGYIEIESDDKVFLISDNIEARGMFNAHTLKQLGKYSIGLSPDPERNIRHRSLQPSPDRTHKYMNGDILRITDIINDTKQYQGLTVGTLVIVDRNDSKDPIVKVTIDGKEDERVIWEQKIKTQFIKYRQKPISEKKEKSEHKYKPGDRLRITGFVKKGVTEYQGLRVGDVGCVINYDTTSPLVKCNTHENESGTACWWTNIIKFEHVPADTPLTEKRKEELAVGDHVKLKSLNFTRKNHDLGHHFGHYPGDVGEIIRFHADQPIVFVPGRESQCSRFKPNVAWSSLDVMFEKTKDPLSIPEVKEGDYIKLTSVDKKRGSYGNDYFDSNIGDIRRVTGLSSQDGSPCVEPRGFIWVRGEVTFAVLTPKETEAHLRTLEPEYVLAKYYNGDAYYWVDKKMYKAASDDDDIKVRHIISGIVYTSPKSKVGIGYEGSTMVTNTLIEVLKSVHTVTAEEVLEKNKEFIPKCVDYQSLLKQAKQMIKSRYSITDFLTSSESQWVLVHYKKKPEQYFWVKKDPLVRLLNGDSAGVQLISILNPESNFSVVSPLVEDVIPVREVSAEVYEKLFHSSRTSDEDKFVLRKLTITDCEYDVLKYHSNSGNFVAYSSKIVDMDPKGRTQALVLFQDSVLVQNLSNEFLKRELADLGRSDRSVVKVYKDRYDNVRARLDRNPGDYKQIDYLHKINRCYRQWAVKNPKVSTLYTYKGDTFVATDMSSADSKGFANICVMHPSGNLSLITDYAVNDGSLVLADNVAYEKALKKFSKLKRDSLSDRDKVVYDAFRPLFTNIGVLDVTGSMLDNQPHKDATKNTLPKSDVASQVVEHIKNQESKQTTKTTQNPLQVMINKMLSSSNLQFGKYTGSVGLAVAINGSIAVRRPDGNYVYYDRVNRQIVETGEMTMDVDFYTIPVQQLQEGDIALIDGHILIVDEIAANGDIRCFNLATGSRTTKLPRTNIFGFHFYTKVISMFDMMGGGQTGFGGVFGGGISPMMLMMMSGDKNPFGGSGEGGNDMMTMMMMSQMFQGGAAQQQGGIFGGLFGQQQQAAPKTARPATKTATKKAVAPKKTTAPKKAATSTSATKKA